MNNKWQFKSYSETKYLDDGITVKEYYSIMDINGELKEVKKYNTEIDEKNRITKKMYYKLEQDFTLWHKTYYVLFYNSLDQIDSEVLYDRESKTSDFLPFVKYKYIYDNNNVIERLTQKYKEDVGFVNYTKDENTYNAQDSLIRCKTYLWENNAWKQVSQINNEYDEAGRITLIHHKGISSTLNKLIDSRKEIFEYKNEMLFKHTRYILTPDGLKLGDIQTYHYKAGTDKIDSIVVAAENDNQQLNDVIIINYYYNEDNNLILTKEKRHLNEDTVNWYDWYRTSYKYYNGTLVGIKNESYNFTYKQWRLYPKETSLRDEAGNEYAISPIDPSNKVYEVEIFFKEQLNIEEPQIVENILFPNPAVDYLNIKNIENISSNIEIHNALGEKLMQVSGSNRIDIRSLPTGVYYVNINGQTEKFIKK